MKRLFTNSYFPHTIYTRSLIKFSISNKLKNNYISKNSVNSNNYILRNINFISNSSTSNSINRQNKAFLSKFYSDIIENKETNDLLSKNKINNDLVYNKEVKAITIGNIKISNENIRKDNLYNLQACITLISPVVISTFILSVIVLGYSSNPSFYDITPNSLGSTASNLLKASLLNISFYNCFLFGIKAANLNLNFKLRSENNIENLYDTSIINIILNSSPIIASMFTSIFIIVTQSLTLNATLLYSLFIIINSQYYDKKNSSTDSMFNTAKKLNYITLICLIVIFLLEKFSKKYNNKSIFIFEDGEGCLLELPDLDEIMSNDLKLLEEDNLFLVKYQDYIINNEDDKSEESSRVFIPFSEMEKQILKEKEEKEKEEQEVEDK